MHKNIILYSLPYYRSSAKKITKNQKITFGTYNFLRFANQEAYIELKQDVKNKVCYIFGFINPPENNLLETLLLIHTLKKEKAAKVIVIIPFLAYMRHEKPEKHKSLGTDLIAKLFGVTGVDKMIAIDIHSPYAQNYFKFPLVSIFPSQLLAAAILKSGWTDFSLVAPDQGAIIRCEQVKKELPFETGLAYFKKTRKEKSIKMILNGRVKKRAIIIDDVLDTGSTLLESVKILKNKGVEEIIILISHGLFIGKKWPELFKFGVKKIYVTNSLKLPENTIPYRSKISVMSLESLIKNI